MDPVKGRKRIFPFGIMMCQDFCGRSKKEIISSKADQRGLCKEKFHSEEQPLPICQWIPATGQAPAFSTSSLQTQPIFDIYYSKWYFFNSLWAAWSVFWADDKSYFFELHLCLLFYNWRLLLPRQCRFFMQNVTVCNFQGTYQFWGFIFILSSIKLKKKKSKKTTFIYPGIFSKEASRVLISSGIRKDVPKSSL